MLYKKDKRVIGIGNLPTCKRKCLYVGNEYCVEKVASFSNDEQAYVFEQCLEYFLGLQKGEPNDNT